MKTPLGMPLSVNGVAPERVSVPVCGAFVMLSVAIEAARLYVVAATVPPTLTEPEFKLKTALFNLLLEVPR